MQRSHGESNQPSEIEQDRDRILDRLRERRVLRPLGRTRAWTRPKVTGFDPMKAKRAYDAFQRVRAVADNPPLRDIRQAEFNEFLTDFLTA